jgi:multidrug efflux pump
MFQIEPNFREGVIHFKPPGSEWWVQMAGAIVWGLSFSTLLTLLLTPVMLALPMALLERSGWLLRRVRGVAPRRRKGAPAGAIEPDPAPLNG